MHTAVIELAMVVVITPLLALGAACFDAIWCQKIVSTVGLNLGKIWMAGAIVAALMVLAGMGFGVLQALGGPTHFDRPLKWADNNHH